MSFSDVWPNLLELCSDHSQTGPLLSPSSIERKALSLKVLFADRQRQLLLPTRLVNPLSQPVAMFINNRFLRWVAFVQLWIDKYLPKGRRLPRVELDEHLLTALFGNASDHSDVAIYCGSPGPLQKLAVYKPSVNSSGGLIAKVALRKTADAVIQTEAHWLQALSESHTISEFVPKLHSMGMLACGRHFLIMKSLPLGIRTAEFGLQHERFLHALSEFTRAGESKTKAMLTDIVQDLQTRLSKISAILGQRYFELIKLALDEISEHTHYLNINTCPVHGDFAAWNVSVSQDRLFVFDWEYARALGNPLHDFLHFHFIPQAAEFGMIKVTEIRQIISKSQTFAKNIFDSQPIDKAACWLALCYLVDTLIFYTEASGRLVTEDNVTNAYLTLLDNRGEWLSASRY